MIDAQPSAVEHPSREVLVEFGSGKLADLAFESVAGHLSRCDTCLSIVADLHARSTADFLEERVRDCLVAPEFRATVTYADAARTPAVSTTSVVAQEGWVGQMVGRYLILKRLGVGGMGVVYLAEDPAVGRAVALKMISAEDMTKTNRLERFRSEGRALARVRHPNVVQFFHFDEHGGHPYFTMEFVDGTSLADRLPGNPLPIREAVELVRTLASAVHALHGQGVIHRDIKPSNILIEADGTPKIADFGLAKLADATGQADRTQTGMVMGTPSYMSPEQAEGRIRDIDLRADVYSLGAVLYAALTGRPPHKGNSVHDTLRLVSTAIPVPPSRGRPDVPKVLDRICEKCLEKSPGRRYPTAQALADDLEDWLEGRPPRGLPGAVGRALRPTRRQALVAGLGLAAFATGVVIYRRDPDVIMANIQADLKAGKQVKLIGDKGSPRWFQWVAGERKGKLETTKDGFFSVRAGDDVALIELMPDPMIDSYRLQVQVRHDAAEIREMSEVGLFVARQGHPVGAAEAQFFIQFSANDILTVADRRVFILPNGQAVPGPEASYLTLRPHLYGADGSAPNTRMSAAISPPIIPAGEAAGVWRTLEVTVTPAGVECAWDNTPLSLSGDDVRQRIAWTARITVGNPVLQNLAPAYVPRGGLGLFVSWGTASFRSATITPLVC